MYTGIFPFCTCTLSLFVRVNYPFLYVYIMKAMLGESGYQPFLCLSTLSTYDVIWGSVLHLPERRHRPSRSYSDCSNKANKQTNKQKLTKKTVSGLS